jgi:hypothetical protein
LRRLQRVSAFLSCPKQTFSCGIDRLFSSFRLDHRPLVASFWVGEVICDNTPRKCF